MLTNASSHPVFIGRSIELQKLQYFLGLASQEKPQICFVVGEAGSGKTSLVNKFLLDTIQLYKDTKIVYAIGECNNIQTNFAEPYLPFKNILRSFVKMLDNSEKKQENIRNFGRVAVRALIKIAPDLIGNFVPGGMILAKGIEVITEKLDIDSKILADRSASQLFSENRISPNEILKQYTSFLEEIAKNYVVILILEDLHWIDQSSTNLLFHLVRSLKKGKIFILCTYRPEDIRISSNGTRHPLDIILNEIKRYCGDVWIDLNQISEAGKREFTNAVIDIEPNQLGESFREKFFNLTEGNALFVTEMLYYMKESGYLVKNSNNEWIEQKELNWNALPSRIEGVIKERFDRLESELKEALTIASVEGENFTAQVVGRLQDVNDRLILERFSQQLAKRHHLVDEEQLIHVEGNDLALFRFAHSLMQKYIYNEISEAEKRLLHKSVANVLEQLYGDEANSIAAQLAHHYDNAHVYEKATKYYILAGDHSLGISAFHEARLYFERAAELEVAEYLGSIHMKLGIAYYGLGLLGQARIALEKSINFFTQTNDLLLIAQGMSWLGRVLVDLGEFLEAKQSIEYGLKISEQSEPELFAHLLNELAYINMSIEQLEISENLNRKSLQICDQYDFMRLKAKVLYDLGCCLHIQGRLPEAIEALTVGLSLAKNLRAQNIVAYCQNELGWIYYETGKYQESLDFFGNGLSTGKSIDNKWLIAEALNGLGFCNCTLGDLGNSETLLKKSLEIGHEINAMTETLLVFVGFANLFIKQNKVQEACQLITIALSHPSSDYEIKHFARITLSEFKDLHLLEIDAQSEYPKVVKTLLT